jgi:iron(III) transport system ATP-binding protein
MSFLPARLTAPGRLMAGSTTLACADDRGLAPGNSVLLGLRPEEVRVRGVAPDTPNAVEVDVASLEFLGAFCRAHLRPVAGAGDLVADFSTNLMRDHAIAEGQRILVALPPDALRVFPADSVAARATSAA